MRKKTNSKKIESNKVLLNRKAFTLIELLAVIVILAIIALIATPLIMNIINDAKKGAFEDSTYGIIKAAEQGYAQSLIKNESVELTQYDYTNRNKELKQGSVEVNYKGSGPESGTLLINEEGDVAVAFYSNGWCITKSYKATQITTADKNKEECIIPEDIPNVPDVGYKDDILNGSDPVLSPGMIPIVYNTISSRWEKADTNSKWYDYETQMWANTVLVTTASRANYRSAAAGTPIIENDVLAYYVWIPRYKYKLFNVSSTEITDTSMTIDIVFENKETTKSTGKINNVDTNGEYLTHPAFTFDDKELNGFWVGKYETTGDATTPTIKPNISSLRNQNISNQFATAQNFNQDSYGLTSLHEAHMMKNTEWGAVAYLLRSQYGKFGNMVYTDAEGLEKELWVNNSSTYITGCTGTSLYSGQFEGCQNTYNTANGFKASTTGNIYGVYDMSGGAGEYVMGNNANLVSSSGFSSVPAKKYLDTYNTSNPTDYNKRILGDATGEIRGLNGIYGGMFYNNYNWFERGGASPLGVNAKIMLFSSQIGAAQASTSFRVVIS